jgi:hypothetical protein
MQEPMESHPDYEPIRRIAASVEAPAGLRERVAAERDRTLIRRTVVKRMKLSGAMAGVAACMGVALALIVPSQGAPSIDDAVALASGAPAAAAPAPVPGHPELLDARVGDVSFPTWSGDVPWKAVGRREDTISGRHAVTVFYDNPAGARLGYTIVDGAALAWPSGARTVTSKGIEIHVHHGGGSVVVVWREHGHSCVMAAPDSVPESRLVELAANVGRYYA